MRKHITCAMALGLMLTASAAAAQTAQATPRTGPAQRLHMGQRIREGVKSGQLTRAELQRMRQQLGRIRQHAQTMRGAGQLTPDQRRQLTQQWRGASRALFRMKHNRLRRGR